MRLAQWMLVAALVLVGCSGDDTSDPPLTQPPGTVDLAVPPAERSPFCARFEALSLAVRTGQMTDDPTTFLTGQYTGLLEVAPAQVVRPLEVILDNLERYESVLSPDDTSPPEAAVPDGSEVDLVRASSLELFTEYATSTCGGAANNPGPPATVPGEGFDVVPDTTAA